MRQPVVIQIARLGVPVSVSSDPQQPDLRWSSDPDINADAPAYLFHDSSEIKAFLNFAIDKRFISEHALETIRIDAPADAQTISRVEAERQGVSSVNWEQVRVGMIISGNATEGPVSEALEWYGERDEYNQGVHLVAAFQHAKARDITSPIIVPHNEGSHTLSAAEFMTEFHQSIKPQLLNAHQVFHRLANELLAIDLESVNPDRALQLLKQLKHAVGDVHIQDNLLRKSLGMDAKDLHPQIPDQTQTNPSHFENDSDVHQVLALPGTQMFSMG